MNDRRGNPSDPAEEAERVRKAYENLETWGKKYGAEFSGGVGMQMGDGKKYNVQIGQPEIAQKVAGRPLPPKEEPKVLDDKAVKVAVKATNDLIDDYAKSLSQEFGAAPDPKPQPKPKRSWFDRLYASIFGE